MINLTVNGESEELSGNCTISAYLESKGLAGRSIAVAVNGTVVRRTEFDDTELNDGDRVEIVRPVGGG